MRTTALTALTLGAGLSSARLIQRQSHDTATGAYNSSAVEEYFVAVCLPFASSEVPDWNTPCWQVQVITDQCTYGSEATWNHTSSNHSSAYDYPERSAREQQQCACGSQIFQAINGCVACADKHGLAGAVPNFEQAAVSSFSSSYCAASNTAAVGFVDALDAAFSGPISTSYPILTATTFSDPIGSRTEVSLYFTPSVTGSAAFVVSQSSGASTTTTTSASNAVQTTFTGGAAQATGVEKAAVAGILGFAAIVAAL